MHQAVNMFISTIKSGILTRRSVGTDSLWKPDSSDQRALVFGTDLSDAADRIITQCSGAFPTMSSTITSIYSRVSHQLIKFTTITNLLVTNFLFPVYFLHYSTLFVAHSLNLYHSSSPSSWILPLKFLRSMVYLTCCWGFFLCNAMKPHPKLETNYTVACKDQAGSKGIRTWNRESVILVSSTPFIEKWLIKIMWIVGSGLVCAK